jgi:hypothetical protein
MGREEEDPRFLITFYIVEQTDKIIQERMSLLDFMYAVSISDVAKIEQLFYKYPEFTDIRGLVPGEITHYHTNLSWILKLHCNTNKEIIGLALRLWGEKLIPTELFFDYNIMLLNEFGSLPCVANTLESLYKTGWGLYYGFKQSSLVTRYLRPESRYHQLLIEHFRNHFDCFSHLLPTLEQANVLEVIPENMPLEMFTETWFRLYEMKKEISLFDFPIIMNALILKNEKMLLDNADSEDLLLIGLISDHPILSMITEQKKDRHFDRYKIFKGLVLLETKDQTSKMDRIMNSTRITNGWAVQQPSYKNNNGKQLWCCIDKYLNLFRTPLTEIELQILMEASDSLEPKKLPQAQTSRPIPYSHLSIPVDFEPRDNPETPFLVDNDGILVNARDPLKIWSMSLFEKVVKDYAEKIRLNNPREFITRNRFMLERKCPMELIKLIHPSELNVPFYTAKEIPADRDVGEYTPINYLLTYHNQTPIENGEFLENLIVQTKLYFWRDAFSFKTIVKNMKSISSDMIKRHIYKDMICVLLASGVSHIIAKEFLDKCTSEIRPDLVDKKQEEEEEEKLEKAENSKILEFKCFHLPIQNLFSKSQVLQRLLEDVMDSDQKVVIPFDDQVILLGEEISKNIYDKNKLNELVFSKHNAADFESSFSV